MVRVHRTARQRGDGRSPAMPAAADWWYGPANRARIGRILRSSDGQPTVAALSGRGQPLPAAVRAYFEPRFGQDLGSVRVHTDDRAARSARDLAARAYTVGSHIVFGRDQFSPHGQEGKRLIAHELAHVVQQRALPAGIAFQRTPDEWQIDGGKYYKLKASAETRATELREKYATVEVFQREDGNWQCRYKAAAAQEKAPEAKTAAPAKLELFSKGVGAFSQAELNEALYTVFGEISAQPHGKLAAEAHAVASTIFNRKADIDSARAAHTTASSALGQARTERLTAIARYEELTRNPSKYRKAMGSKQYDEAVAKAKASYEQAKTAYASASPDHPLRQRRQDSRGELSQERRSREVPRHIDHDRGGSALAVRRICQGQAGLQLLFIHGVERQGAQRQSLGGGQEGRDRSRQVTRHGRPLSTVPLQQEG